jgi:protein-tyrosine phosphatase
MAEAVLRSMLVDVGLDSRIEVSSAGTGDWHVGEGADPRTVEVLSRRGYDASRHEARQFTSELLADNDVVLAVDRSTQRVLTRLSRSGGEKIRLLREFDPTAGTDVDVPDPYFGGPDGFDTVLDMVERACRGLLDTLTANLQR